MTIPRERRASLLTTYHFLLALLDPKETPRVPREVRRWAAICLRHYPRTFEIEQLAELAPHLFGDALFHPAPKRSKKNEKNGRV